MLSAKVDEVPYHAIRKFKGAQTSQEHVQYLGIEG